MKASAFAGVETECPGVGDAGDSSARRRISLPARWFLSFASAAAVAALAGFSYHYWPRTLVVQQPRSLLTVGTTADHCTVSMLDRKLVADLAEFDDRFFAYLMFDNFRSQPELGHYRLFLVSDAAASGATYRVAVELPSDLITAVEELALWQDEGLTSELNYRWYTESVVDRYAAETSFLVHLFRTPSDDPLRLIDPGTLRMKLGQFIRFKSLTDRRTRGNPDGAPSPLNRDEADQLAADMMTVADFFEIPLSLMVGVGAMENNYMSVPGDLENTKWKRHADPGDVILRRVRKGVLVKNDSSGVWQITRESLRDAHRLYLRDSRDYTRLPARLRPPREFRMEDVTGELLTTYAGLLLADLLEQFHGDVILAAGAYNGTVQRPNFQYASGVDMVACYARTVIARAALLDASQAQLSPIRDGNTSVQVAAASSSSEASLPLSMNASQNGIQQ
ncbi:MAG: hypothetical protein ACJ74Y_06630 [Bryobacteraceae bacterium]